jgi:hypothetical protein
LLSRGSPKLPRHHSGQDVPRFLCFLAALSSAASSGLHATRFHFFLVGVSSAASLWSGCYPASSLLSRGFRNFRDITQVWMLPAVFSFSSASAPRHRSGQDATRLRLCFLAAFRSFRGISQVRMLPAVFSFSSAFSSAASLRLVCYPCP